MKRKLKSLKDEDCIEIEKPKIKEEKYLDLTKQVDVKFNADKKIFVIECNNMDIVKSLLERYGGEMPLVEVITNLAKSNPKCVKNGVVRLY
jgi:hypothetical protein